MKWKNFLIALFGLILALSFLVLCLVWWPSGDVSFDGKVTLTDLVIMRRNNLNLLQRITGDMNNDFRIDFTDFELLKQKLLDSVK
jgi:hypothetical protein